jgi:3-hydroxyisobutyrate dehydrogenase-like beta-hydroxyacid dehydrogenase
MMGDITQIGLGLMGSALARAFLAGGHQVTIWNRSANKTAALASSGARSAITFEDAVLASPVVIVCIDNYGNTLRLFEQTERYLAGKTVIQLSTGSPRAARDSAKWFKDRGADYLDGAILASPSAIGKDALIVVAGAAATFERCKPFLAAVAGDLRYVGANIGTASALDLAWLSEYYGFFLGVIHGVRVCESEGVPLDQYAALAEDGSRSKWLLSIIASGRFENPSATLAVWYAALRRIKEHGREAGLSCEIPDFAATYFEHAIASGHGEEHVAALVKARPAR